MTKRFLIDDAGELIDLNNHKFIDYGDECCKLLNDLYDENQLLHKINEGAIDFMYDNFDLNIIFTNRELNDICNEMGWELSEKGIKIKQLEKENEQLKSTIAQLIEQNRKNNDLLLSDIRILEKALWCGGCENDYGRLKELRKEFMK